MLARRQSQSERLMEEAWFVVRGPETKGAQQFYGDARLGRVLPPRSKGQTRRKGPLAMTYS
jgi:hypothetical protein